MFHVEHPLLLQPLPKSQPACISRGASRAKELDPLRGVFHVEHGPLKLVGEYGRKMFHVEHWVEVDPSIPRRTAMVSRPLCFRWKVCI